MRRLFSILSLSIVLLFSVAARADTFALDFTTTHPDAGLLVLTGAAGSTPGTFNITSVSGNINGNSISIVSGPTPGQVFIDPTGNYSADNIFYIGSEPFDSAGLYVTDGVNYYNFYDYRTLSVIDPTTGDEIYNTSVTYTTAPPPVPEPSSLALLGTGMLTAVGAARRKFAKR